MIGEDQARGTISRKTRSSSARRRAEGFEPEGEYRISAQGNSGVT